MTSCGEGPRQGRQIYSKPAGDVRRESDGLLAENTRLLAEQRSLSALLANGKLRLICLLCGAVLSDAPSFDHRGTAYARCAACGHIQTRMKPPPGYPDAFASDLSFSNWYLSPDRSAFESRRDRIYSGKLDFILQAAPDLGLSREELLGRRWLELGCGAGFFLDLLLRAGVAVVTGLDASAPLIEQANRMALAPVARHWTGDLHSALDVCPADIIVAWFVLEHIEEAEVFWRSLARCAPGTLFCFSVPTLGLSTLLEGAVSDHFARNLDSVLHCQLYSEESIRYGLMMAGFEPVLQWVFGQDALDLRRLLEMSLLKRASPVLLDALGPSLDALIDPIQTAVDHAHLADARHVIAIKR